MKYPRYPAYKDSGVEWIGEIPEKWKYRRLKNIIYGKITDGPHITPEFTNEGYPFLSVDGIQDGELSFDDCRFIRGNNYIEFSKKAKPNFNDILIGKAASVGKIARVKVNFDFAIWSPLALIKLNKNVVVPEFAEYLLKSSYIQFQIEKLSTYNTQKNISMDDLPKIEFFIPEPEEQELIACFIDNKLTKLEFLLSNLQKMIELLKEKRQAIITHAVTKGLDPNVPMKDSGVEWVGEIPEHWNTVQSKWLMSCNDEVIPENSSSGLELTYVEISDVDFTKGITNSELMKFEDAPSRARRKVRDGDIIISTVRTYLKAIAEIKNPDNNLVVSTGFAVLRPRKVLQSFAKYALSASYFIEKVISESFGVSYPAITADRLVSIKLAVPDIKTQEEIADFLDNQTMKIDSLVKKQGEMIDLLNEYHSTLISAAVTGKIDVRNLKNNDFPESE